MIMSRRETGGRLSDLIMAEMAWSQSRTPDVQSRGGEGFGKPAFWIPSVVSICDPPYGLFYSGQYDAPKQPFSISANSQGLELLPSYHQFVHHSNLRKTIVTTKLNTIFISSYCIHLDLQFTSYLKNQQTATYLRLLAKVCPDAMADTQATPNLIQGFRQPVAVAHTPAA